MWNKIHPVRATLAVTGWLATIFFLWIGVELPEAWWALVSAISVFYFTGTKEGQ